MSILGNFKVVSENEKGYVEKLEQKYSISLPPVFKAFCRAVYLNSLKADEGYRLYHPDEEREYPSMIDFSQLLQIFWILLVNYTNYTSIKSKIL